MSEYHGRIFITYKLYVRYTNSYVYEDSTIFSPEDSGMAMDEFAGRLTSVVAGASPAKLRLSAVPEDALVLVNRAYAGRGEAAEREYPPGKITLEVSADHYEDVKTELELRPGEFTDVTVNLRPLEMITVRITDPLRVGVSLYSGSLYVGKAPLTLELHPGQLEYIHAQSVDGQESKVVLLTPSLNILPPPVRNSRLSSYFPDQSLFKNSLRGNELSLYTTFPYDPEAGRVDKARSGYYWAWGGTWISAIAAWMINGYSNSIIDSYNSNTNTDMSTAAARYKTAKQAQYLNTAGLSLVGTAILFQAIQMTRYINTAGEDAPSYVD
jgi:hypothetical protein